MAEKASLANPSLPLHEVLEGEFVALHGELQSIIRRRPRVSVTFRPGPREILEIIADNLSKAGWSWGCVSGVNSRWRTIFVADAYRDGGKRFVVRADEKLTAFVELELAIRGRYNVIHQFTVYV